MIPLNKFILGEDIKTVVDVEGGSSTVKDNKIDISRIDLDQLEAIYITDALVRNSISASVCLFDYKYKINASSAKIRTETEEFMRFINYDSLKLELAKNAFVYGDGWLEQVYKGKELLGVVNLNPKRVDYQKDMNGRIELDAKGKIKGYVQKIGYEQSSDDNIRGKVESINGVPCIKLKPEQIAHFYFDSVGEGWYGIGLIEPIYSITLGKNEAEMGLSHVINKVGFPIIINKIGTPEHQPTPEMIDKGLEIIKDLNYKSDLAIPYYMDIDTLKITRIEKLGEYLQYFIEQQITGIGIPGGIATGSGESINRSTLVTQVKMFMKINETRRKKQTNRFEDTVLRALAKSKGWKEIPTIEIIPTDLDNILEDIKKDKTGGVG
ncbi:MAG: hypothetical protein ACTSWK_00410 [Promethearchaeota archaeon]